MNVNPTSASFFNDKYTHKKDPWNFSTCKKEQNRYAAIIKILGPRYFKLAFEAGCANGALTKRLSPCVQSILAFDFSSKAIELAIANCSNCENVKYICGALPKILPNSQTDLIVICEIGYYFKIVDWKKIINLLVQKTKPGTVFIATHWLGYSIHHAIRGNKAHAVLHQNKHLKSLSTRRYSTFILNKWVRL